MRIILGTRKIYMFIFVVMVSLLFQLSGFGESINKAAKKEPAAMTASDKEADAKIKAVWNAMKAALRAGDANKALKSFSPVSAAKYKEEFDLLDDDLPAIANGMGDIEFVSIYENVAEYNIQKNEVIKGEPQKMNYPISFVRDSAGNWYIDEF